MQEPPITVLIADDEAAIRNGLQEIVARIQANTRVVACADSGESALQSLRALRPDIAVMDISMPGISGLDVIRTAAEEKLPTAFLILSGYNDFSFAQQAIRYGVKSYFLKPLDVEEFREAFLRQCGEVLRLREGKEGLDEGRISIFIDSSRTLFLNQLIQKHFYKAEDIEEKLRLLRCSVRDEASCIVLFSLLPAETGVSFPEDAPARVSALFSGFPCECWAASDTQLLALVNARNAGEKRLHDCVLSCVSLLSREDASVKAAVGAVVKCLQLIHASYSSAVEALSYRIYDTQAILFDSSVITRERPRFSTENIDYKPLIYALTHQDGSGVSDYCEAFFSSLLAAGTPPPSYVIGMCIYLVVNVQKQLELLYPEAKLPADLDCDVLYTLDSVTELRRWVTELLESYGALLTDSAVERNGIIRAAKEYIQQNLDKNIKAKDVAEQVHLSETYFTVYFKNKTGTNFRDYLLHARMALAQKLLASRDINISEIAYRVGYQDYRSFSRAFKTETGMSPSEYINSL